MSVSRKTDFWAPVRVATSGLVYTFKTQRHMRFHLYVVLIVMLLGVFFNLGLREMLVLLFTISLVLVAEMFNSAIEATVDLVQPNYHPLAKFAKDIAAGAVLITTIIAVVVGSLMILGENRWEQIKVNLTSESLGVGVVPRMVLGAFVLFIVVVVGKGLGKQGQVFKGGLVSGHAAYGFFFAGAIVFLTDNPVVSGLALLLAAIIAQSRWEAKIHTVFELSLGAAAGVLVSMLLFGLLPK
ncbi:MAG: diacylglycerol kinase [Fimbriimonadaceae bacterium]|jgi:diacylglycerol kinase (ATP)|nr:diacylglycerol kinase [Chthonomonadaceae bacterium]MCO5297731.1 diacylglycerol kinase [Fimbriimonadaceae bacterium]